MTIYAITSDALEKIDETSFAEAGVKERHDLQRLLRTQIDVISPDTLVIAEEFGEWQDSKRRIDLLGLDKDANLVVIELKRTEDGGHMELHPASRGRGIQSSDKRETEAGKDGTEVQPGFHEVRRDDQRNDL